MARLLDDLLDVTRVIQSRIELRPTYRLAYERKLRVFSSKPALEIAFSPADSFTLKCDDKVLNVGIPAKEPTHSPTRSSPSRASCRSP